MATLEDLAARVEALERAQTAVPVSYYTSRYSGEEMDERLDAAGMLGGSAQQALANLGAGVRPNLLDNPGLAVNQRGLSQYTGAVQTVDRWMAGNSCTWEKVTGGWKITQGTENGFAICQKKEKIAAGTYTISVIVSAVTGTWGLLIQNQQEDNLMITEPGFYSATVTVDESDASPYLFVLCSTQVGDTITLPSDDGEIAKVEAGEGQTLAYQDEDGALHRLPQPDADYATQLMMCQQRLLMLGAQIIPVAVFSNSITGVIPTPVSMDNSAAPTVTFSGSAFLYTPSGPISVPLESFSGVSAQANGVLFSGTTDVSSNVPAVLVVDKIAISREI